MIRNQVYRTKTAYVATRVVFKDKPKRYQLDDEAEHILTVINPDTLVIPLEPNTKVMTPNGQAINPTGAFYITAQTINPYHLILDVLDQNMLDFAGHN